MGMQGNGPGYAGSITKVRMFLRADSAEELVRMQLENNVQLGGQCDYTDFQHSPIDKKWYCWFLIDMELLQEKRSAKPIKGGK